MQFELKGQQYRTTNMDVFTQLKVARKLLPVLAGMVSDLSIIREAAGNQERVMNAIQSILPKVAGELADMSDDSVDAILKPCLSVVSRQNGTNWTSLINSGQLMFDDINLLTMLEIVGKVIGENIGDFLPEPPRQRDANPASGLTLDTLHDGLDYLLRPVDAGLCHYIALKDGSLSLYDVALMNDYLDMKADNEMRIQRWREANER